MVIRALIIMSRRIGLLIFLTICTAASLANATVTTIEARSLSASLQSVIDSSRPGDTLQLSGHFRLHNLNIVRPITIIGLDSAVVEADSAGDIIHIRSASDVTIQGLTFKNVPVSFLKEFAAINLSGASNCRILDNTFVDNFFGIYLSDSKQIVIERNNLTGADRSMSHAGNGIHLWNSREVTINHNRIVGHRDGIYFEYARQIDVQHNHSERNLRYGIHFMFSDSCNYSHNEFISNAAGIAVMYTNRVTMIDNLFQDSWGAAAYGLLLKDIKDSKVLNNRLVRNSVAFQMEGCDRIHIEGNALIDNGWAMRIMANCTDNKIIGNDFVGNSFQVATNSRINYNSFDGNYWSVYAGFDLDKDGFGDVPFRPVSLYGLVVEQRPPSIILMRSLLVEILNLAERLIPTITPETLMDSHPAMRRLL
jgi:nitrous oxidase accessory protein